MIKQTSKKSGFKMLVWVLVISMIITLIPHTGINASADTSIEDIVEQVEPETVEPASDQETNQPAAPAELMEETEELTETPDPNPVSEVQALVEVKHNPGCEFLQNNEGIGHNKFSEEVAEEAPIRLNTTFEEALDRGDILFALGDSYTQNFIAYSGDDIRSNPQHNFSVTATDNGDGTVKITHNMDGLRLGFAAGYFVYRITLNGEVYVAFGEPFSATPKGSYASVFASGPFRVFPNSINVPSQATTLTARFGCTGCGSVGASELVYELQDRDVTFVLRDIDDNSVIANPSGWKVKHASIFEATVNLNAAELAWYEFRTISTEPGYVLTNTGSALTLNMNVAQKGAKAYLNYKAKAQVNYKYVDTKGNAIKAPTSSTGYRNETTTLSTPNIEGFRFVSATPTTTSGQPVSGTLSGTTLTYGFKNATTITLVYEEAYDLALALRIASVGDLAYDPATKAYFPQEVCYAIDVTNSSNGRAKASKVNVTLPAEFSFNPAKNPGWTQTGSTLSYNGKLLNIDEVENIVLKLNVSYLEPTTTVTVTAAIGSVLNAAGETKVDVVPANNTASVTLNIENIYDMELGFTATKITDGEGIEADVDLGTSPSAKAKYNDIITYRVDVSNLSNMSMLASKIRFDISAGLEPVSDFGGALVKNSATEYVLNDTAAGYIGTLAKDGSGHFDIQFRVKNFDAASSETVKATIAELSIGEALTVHPEDITPLNNTETVSVDVENIYNMALGLTPRTIEDSNGRNINIALETDPKAKYNDVITYRVSLENLSNLGMLASKIKFTVDNLVPTGTFASLLTEVSENVYMLDDTATGHIGTLAKNGEGYLDIQFKVTTITEETTVSVTAEIAEMSLGIALDYHPEDVDPLDNDDTEVLDVYNPPIIVEKRDVEKQIGEDGSLLEGALVRLVKLGGVGGVDEIVRDNVMSDENGEFTFREIYPGEYHILEIDAPIGFCWSDRAWKIERDDAMDIVPGSDVIVFNTPTSVTLHKFHEGTERPLAGAVFEVIDSEGNVVRTGTSDASGEMTFKYLPSESTYTYREVQAPGGFMRNPNSFTFSIAKDGTIEGDLYLGNRPINIIPRPRFDVTLTCVDNETSARLEGAYAEVYNMLHEVVATGTFNSKGELTVTQLDSGEYYVIAKSSPEGYKLNLNPIVFSIGNFGEIKGTTEIRLDPFNVIIRKIDSITGAPLAGATIVVNKADGTFVFRGVTDSLGCIKIERVVASNYEFHETEAPAGYILDSEVRTFLVTELGQVVGTTILGNTPMEIVPVEEIPEEPVIPEEPSAPVKTGYADTAMALMALALMALGIYFATKKAEVK